MITATGVVCQLDIIGVYLAPAGVYMREMIVLRGNSRRQGNIYLQPDREFNHGAVDDPASHRQLRDTEVVAASQ